ncbi:MAG: UPF0175 family protein [Lachnospiraceae bacterium]|nr:UPF0175 family protein [Lachnospiraceae bacterium]
MEGTWYGYYSKNSISNSGKLVIYVVREEGRIRMSQITISIPDEVLYETKMNKEDASNFVRKAVALGYYTQKGVSIGYCARIAGLPEEDFITYLGKNHISIFHFDNEEEFTEELDTGIDDMEAGREMPLEDAFVKIEDLRKHGKREKI